MDKTQQGVNINSGDAKETNPLIFLNGTLFLLVLIALIFGLLHYLDILRLDFYIPALSFLPHIERKAPYISPARKLPPQSYNQTIPESDLPAFIKQVLKPQFLPGSFTITSNLNENKQQTDTDYTFGTAWTIGDAEFHGFYHFNMGTSEHMDSQVEIFLYPTNPTTDAKSLISTYFNTDGSKAKCKVLDVRSNLTICEAFYPDLLGTKHGFGAVINIQNQSRHEDMVFACEIPSGSLHADWKSCVQQYATTGITGQ